MAGTLVAEALAKGDLGIAVAVLAPGSVATAIGLWGTEEQQATYLPAFTGDKRRPPPRWRSPSRPSSSTCSSPRPRRRARTTAGPRRRSRSYPAAPTPSCSWSAPGSTGANALFLVEAGAAGLSVEADPAMGVRAASLTKVVLDGVGVPAGALLGSDDGATYAECVRLSRLAWCALAVGPGRPCSTT